VTLFELQPVKNDFDEAVLCCAVLMCRHAMCMQCAAVFSTCFVLHIVQDPAWRTLLAGVMMEQRS
jgi:hypothetical protein